MTTTVAATLTIKRGDFARIAGTTWSRSHVKRVLCGERIPSRELAEKIAEYFGKTVSDLFPELEKVA